MNLRQLQYFLAVMEHGSLASASKVAHISESALSRSLKALEASLRAPLFDRIEGRLYPTPFALAYRERAKRIIFEEEEGSRTIALMRHGQLGPLSFGMGSTLTYSLLAPLFLHMLAKAPTLQLRALTKTSDILLGELEGERIDFFVGDVRVAEHRPDVHIETLSSCSIEWFARSGHPLAKEKAIAFKTIKSFPIIAAGFFEKALVRQLADTYDLSFPVTDQFDLITDDLTTLLKVVTGSDMICLTTTYAMADAWANGSVVRLSVEPELDLNITFGIMRRAGRTLAPAVEEIFSFIRAYFQKLDATSGIR